MGIRQISAFATIACGLLMGGCASGFNRDANGIEKEPPRIREVALSPEQKSDIDTAANTAMLAVLNGEIFEVSNSRYQVALADDEVSAKFQVTLLAQLRRYNQDLCFNNLPKIFDVLKWETCPKLFVEINTLAQQLHLQQ